MNIPAFPNDVKQISERAGMTLRDYFAAKAMQALMDESTDIARTKLWIAITAYSMADAMLEERK